MAISPKNLRKESSSPANKRIIATGVQPKTFAADSGGSEVTFPRGTLLSYNTSTGFWVPWAHSGANGTGIIRGIAWPNEVVINASGGGERVNDVMIAGEAHWEDLVSHTGTEANRLAAMRTQDPSLRELGITILDLDQVN